MIFNTPLPTGLAWFACPVCALVVIAIASVAYYRYKKGLGKD